MAKTKTKENSYSSEAISAKLEALYQLQIIDIEKFLIKTL